jgi:retron-type reverse transcriptase
MENNNIYSEIYSMNNLIPAWKKARNGKTKKLYVIEFEQNTRENLLKLHEELENQTYAPKPLKTFILRDPKTRKISKSSFRDRLVHHALVRILEPIFDKTFIYNSCANRIGKGNLFALKRFELFKRKVTNNLCSESFCLKADIKHYFQEVNHKILIGLIKRKIIDKKIISLIDKILINGQSKEGVGMPLGNLTSQFFANIYLNELDYFIKHKLRAKYYIRYVDDFVILHNSKEQLQIWKIEIDEFLKQRLKLELHTQKSKIIFLSRGIDFVGFRSFWHYRLLRNRNIKKMLVKVEEYKQGELPKEKLLASFQGWNAYAKWANSYKLRKKVVKRIYS